MDKPWRIELLGWLRAVHSDRVVTRFRSHQTGGLLAYLAHHCHRSHPRDALVELLWPEGDLADGRNSLRVALSSLRRQLELPGMPPGAVLIADRSSIQLNPAACTTDVAAFESALRAVAPSGRPAAGGIERMERLIEAVELYRGELLPGYFEEWIMPERLRLAEAFFAAVSELIQLLEQRGDLGRALQYARRAVSADPLREEAHHEVMRLLAATHQPEAALRQFEELERLLARELGVTPSPEIRAFAHELERPRKSPLREAKDRETEGRAQEERVGDRPSTLRHPTTPPAGTVTFLLTDIEGSTALWQRAGDAFAAALTSHHDLLRQAFRDHNGYEVKDLGDGFLVTFQRASSALACAVAGQRALTASPWPEPVGRVRVRMALHTGDAEPQEGDYHGLVVHCAQRMLVAGHGGQILCSEETANLLRRDLDPQIRLVDQGVYRLRDVVSPERLFQVEYPEMAQREFPPLTAAPAHVGHLPPKFNRFFGREAELTSLYELLSGHATETPGTTEKKKPVTRLVTLTGPGGTGKTRLAHEVAERLWDPLRSAVWFVALADLNDAGLLLAELLDSLRLSRSSPLDPMEQVVATLARQPSLLLLDNFEHLVENGVSLVQTLLERVPTLRILVTSRQRLGLSAEREFVVHPLPVPVEGQALRVEGRTAVDRSDSPVLHPPPSTVAACASVQLFMDRAQAARPDFQITATNAAAVASLCARLEGLPLALELAAARARLLTPQQMLVRLEQREGALWDMLVSRQRELDPRHRSLRATLDWSYQLLAPELRRFFARLCVFRGGWTLAAAEAVCEQPLALEYLEQLTECSLVLAEQPSVTRRDGVGNGDHFGPGALNPGPARLAADPEMRFRLLETLREYAAEQLPPEERAALTERHAAYYCALAEQAERELQGAGQVQWLERLEQEHDNLRAALDWAMEQSSIALRGDNPERPADNEALITGLRLAGALWEFWAPRGYVAEGRARLAKLLALSALDRSQAAGEVRPQAPGDPSAGASLQRPTAAAQARAKALACAGILAQFQGDYTEARAFLEESLAIRRELGSQWQIAFSLTALAAVARYQSDYMSARMFGEEGLKIWRALDEKPGVAWSINHLAVLAGHQGDYATQRVLHEQGLAIRRELGDWWGAAFSLSGLGTMARHLGDWEAARSFYEEALAIRRELGDEGGIATSLSYLGQVALHRGDPDQASPLLEESLRIRQALGDQTGIAGSLHALGLIACHRGDWERARSLFEESLLLRREAGDREGIAECLEGLAWVTCARGQFLRAARLFGAAAALREALGAPLSPGDRAHYEQHVEASRAGLGEAAFAAAWEEGRALTAEQAVAELLAAPGSSPP
jgi:predicted ATPase/DNA-binding SARP family transcriptional activator